MFETNKKKCFIFRRRRPRRENAKTTAPAVVHVRDNLVREFSRPREYGVASSVVNRRKGRKKKKMNAPGGDISIARVLDRQCAGHGGVAQLSRVREQARWKCRRDRRDARNGNHILFPFKSGMKRRRDNGVVVSGLFIPPSPLGRRIISVFISEDVRRR